MGRARVASSHLIDFPSANPIFSSHGSGGPSRNPPKRRAGTKIIYVDITKASANTGRFAQAALSRPRPDSRLLHRSGFAGRLCNRSRPVCMALPALVPRSVRRNPQGVSYPASPRAGQAPAHGDRSHGHRSLLRRRLLVAWHLQHSFQATCRFFPEGFSPQDPVLGHHSGVFAVDLCPVLFRESVWRMAQIAIFEKKPSALIS
jgi:hypothetical protein